MIWIGLLIGLALGGAVGVVIMALIRASGDDGKLYKDYEEVENTNRIDQKQLSNNDLIKIFKQKEAEFSEHYKFRAKYVKVPLCLFNQIYNASCNCCFSDLSNSDPFDDIHAEKGRVFLLFGYQVCWTETIEKIEDIELF